MFISIPFLFVAVGPIELMVCCAIIVGFLFTWDFSGATLHSTGEVD
jgi:hypothetical protein